MVDLETNLGSKHLVSSGIYRGLRSTISDSGNLVGGKEYYFRLGKLHEGDWGVGGGQRLGRGTRR